jgi:hypothetical protein
MGFELGAAEIGHEVCKERYVGARIFSWKVRLCANDEMGRREVVQGGEDLRGVESRVERDLLSSSARTCPSKTRRTYYQYRSELKQGIRSLACPSVSRPISFWRMQPYRSKLDIIPKRHSNAIALGHTKLLQSSGQAVRVSV